MTSQRILYLDNLKILLTFMVIFLHAIGFYIPWEPWWFSDVQDFSMETMLVLFILYAGALSFGMGLFFFVSAYFVPGSFDRKGAGKFIRDRLVRLGIPTLAFIVAIGPELYYLWLRSLDEGISFTWFYLHHTALATGDPQMLRLMYVWFIFDLFVLALLYALWRMAGIQVPHVRCPGTITLILVAVVLGFGEFFLRAVFPGNLWAPFGMFRIAEVTQYLLFFLAGILAYRNGWLDALPSSSAWIWGCIVGTWLLLAAPLYITFGDAVLMGGGTIPSFIFSMGEGFAGVGIPVIMIVLFRDRWNCQGPVGKTMAENVYSVYLIHVPIVIALQVMIAATGIHPLGKILLVTAIAIPVSFLVSQYGVRKIPYVNRVLF